MTTLYREIDALGGAAYATDPYSQGHNKALCSVLEVLTKRGFTEEADACGPAVERLAYGYELMHRAICNLAGTSGADPRWYMEVAQVAQSRVAPVFGVGPDSNPHKPGDCLSGYKKFANTFPEAAAQPLYDRLVALADRVANSTRPGGIMTDPAAEARAIMAELAPVDPDLVLAREIAEDVGFFSANILPRLRSGGSDDTPAIKALVKAIKRTRALASGSSA